MLLKATRTRKDAEMQWASAYLQGGGGRRRRGWGRCGGVRHAKVTKDSRGGVTGFRETWEEGEGDGIAQCIFRGYMRGPEDIWLRCNASGTYTWENE